MMEGRKENGWWGTLIGGTVGFFFGGPLGALLGAAVGHGLGKTTSISTNGYFGFEEQERVQTAFFTTTFSVMGHLATVDGKVSEEEVAAVQRIMAHMRLRPEQQQAAVNLFNQGKRVDFPLDEVLEQFRRECHGRRDIVRMFLEILVTTAMADGELTASEYRMLSHVCDRVRFPRTEFEHMVSMMQTGYHGRDDGGFADAPPRKEGRLKDAYGVLGLSEGANDDEVKKAYRNLLNQYHPDKLVSKGLPEEMMKFATEKTQQIKAAYDRIRESR
jgi:DnaJ like chaperone protein